MSQAIVKDLRKDLAALSKRQEIFEDKILTNTLSKEDAEYMKSMSLAYAEEARKVRAKIMDLLTADAGEPAHESADAPEQVQ